MAIYQIVIRIGWVFKTESIIMPAVLDSLDGAGWLRGMLPMLNRIGQSIPPLLLAGRINTLPLKKSALFVFTAGMSLAFAGFSMLWWTGIYAKPIAPVIFLLIYAFFFCCTGLVNMTFGTLQGKLIPVMIRGRLLMVANSVGALLAVFFAWWLMGRWLSTEGGEFAYVFGFTSLSFAVAALIALLIREHRDQEISSGSSAQSIVDAWRVLGDDPAYRKLLVIAVLFGSSMTIFPHYQALARERLGLSFEAMTGWVIIQNLGTGVFGILFGSLADRSGNRTVLRIAMLGVAAIPVLALVLSHSGDIGRRYFWVVFVLFSLTPVTIKVLNNFALEFTQTDSHPRYLSLMAIGIAFPIYFSPLFGLIVDRFGFDLPMALVSYSVAVGWIMTMFVSEPRHRGSK